MAPQVKTSDDEVETVVGDVELGSDYDEDNNNDAKKAEEHKEEAPTTASSTRVRKCCLYVFLPLVVLSIILLAVLNTRRIICSLPPPVSDTPTPTPLPCSEDPNCEIIMDGLGPVVPPQGGPPPEPYFDDDGNLVLADNSTALDIWGFSGSQNLVEGFGKSSKWQSGAYEEGAGPWFKANSTGFYSSQFNFEWSDTDIEFTNIYHYGSTGEDEAPTNVCFGKTWYNEDETVLYNTGTIFTTPLAAELLQMIQEKIVENNPNTQIEFGN